MSFTFAALFIAQDPILFLSRFFQNDFQLRLLPIVGSEINLRPKILLRRALSAPGSACSATTVGCTRSKGKIEVITSAKPRNHSQSDVALGLTFLFGLKAGVMAPRIGAAPTAWGHQGWTETGAQVLVEKKSVYVCCLRSIFLRLLCRCRRHQVYNNQSRRPQSYRKINGLRVVGVHPQHGAESCASL